MGRRCLREQRWSSTLPVSPIGIRYTQEALEVEDVGCVFVPLTRGKVAIIDSCDAHLILPYKWHATAKGYAARRPRKGGPTEFMHRVILGLPIGERVLEADHINRDRLDNRRSNLRVATSSLNSANAGRTIGISGLRGVTWQPRCGRWRARIEVNGREHFLGHFSSVEEAARAYDIAALEHFGVFATLNFSDREAQA